MDGWMWRRGYEAEKMNEELNAYRFVILPYISFSNTNPWDIVSCEIQ